MIKLPRPSSLSMRGSADEKFTYLISYLSQLVDEIERITGKSKTNEPKEKTFVADVSSVDNYLVIRYSDGSVKKIAKE